MFDDRDESAGQPPAWNAAAGSAEGWSSTDPGQRQDNRTREGGYGGTNRETTRDNRPRSEYTRSNREGFNRDGGNFRDREDFGRNREGGSRFNREGGNFRGDRGADESFEVLNVPSRFVGRVIGRGGSKINELQAESGARIQVTKDTDGDNTIVKLFGDEGSKSKAKSLIHDLTTLFSR